MGDIPATVTRTFCSDKGCKEVTLYLQVIRGRAGEGEAAVPTLFNYFRLSDGKPFELGPGWSTRKATMDWLERTKPEAQL